MNDLRHYFVTATLKNGTTVTIRADEQAWEHDLPPEIGALEDYLRRLEAGVMVTPGPGTLIWRASCMTADASWVLAQISVEISLGRRSAAPAVVRFRSIPAMLASLKSEFVGEELGELLSGGAGRRLAVAPL